MIRLLLMVLLTASSVLLTTSCGRDLERERLSHLAARSLVAAPDRAVAAELNRVVAVGAFALPDIEQEIHAAPAAGRLRLLRAIERIGSPQAIPLLRFLVRWDTDDAVRREAQRIARQLSHSWRHPV